MASLFKTTFALAFAITSLSTSAFADTYRHIDQLALSIERQSKQLVSEVRHYRHTSVYRHLVEDARDMARLADHLHDVAHHHGSLAHLESDLRQLDAKFHHLESVFRYAQREASHGHGHIHGEVCHVSRLLRSIEEDIHHLQDDIRSLRRPVCTTNPVVVNRPPIFTSPYTSPFSSRWSGYSARPQSSGFGIGGLHGGNFYGYGSRSRGITIGGGSSRITIGF